MAGNSELFIRHGKSLLLPNLLFHVSHHPLIKLLQGRLTLEALGLEFNEMLAAAPDRHEKLVNAGEILDFI